MVGSLWLLTTVQRVHVWGDERLLWAEAARLAPEKPRPWVNLGNQYARAEVNDLAAEAYQEAIRLAANPRRGTDEQRIGRAIAEAMLARLWFDAGEVQAAITLTAAAADRSGLDSVKAFHAWLLTRAPSASPPSRP